MRWDTALLAGWLHAVLLATAPWMLGWRPFLVPVVLAAALILRPGVLRRRRGEPWTSLVVVLSSVVVLVSSAGVVVAGGWLVLAGVVAATSWLAPARCGRRPDAADLVALVGWSGAFALRPALLGAAGGGWLAPALALVVARRLGAIAASGRPRAAREPEPPSRQVRGTLSLRGIVVGSVDGLPSSVPVDLDLRAGDSLAVLCRSNIDAGALAAVLSGRTPPLDGELAVDGVPLEEDDLLVAVIAPGEPFLAGDLEENLAALAGEAIETDALAAVWEACSLEAVRRDLGECELAPDGAPLDVLHRLLVLAARVIPSDYRVVVVVDPVPWVDPARGEVWRKAVVRASVGRTSIWLTGDRELASRATQVMEFRNGALRRL